MAKTKVLITVTTYPLPSRSYDELVCTAGVLENGDWIRIYPVPLKFLMGLRKDGKIQTFKYSWIELDIKKRNDDFRPESYSPVNYDFKDVITHGKVNTDNNWSERKSLCTKKVYTNLTTLIADSKHPINTSLATFKPKEIVGFEIIEEVDRNWKNEWVELRRQGDLFDQARKPEIIIPKLPYRFYYIFKDEDGTKSRLMIEDWEIGALYWNCLRDSNNVEKIALQKVREQYEINFIKNKDIYFFLGTTKKWHMRRGNNPFVIIGVFYPKIELQFKLDL